MMNPVKKIKPCFGHYEDNDNSWHCVGCVVANECEKYRNIQPIKSGGKKCQDQVKIHTT